MESAREDIGNVMPAAKLDAEGWLGGVRRIPSPNCDERPAGCGVELLVIHHITLPPGKFGGPAIIELFTNRLDPAAHPFYATIAGMKVSAHFLIRRDGGLIQFVPCARRAWHAGDSSWKGRARCNDFSVGVELEGTGEAPFTRAQYACLAALTHALRARYSIADIVGHSDVAPGRKRDPGPSFDWARYRRMLTNLSPRRTPSPHPFPFSRGEKGRLESPLSFRERGGGEGSTRRKTKNNKRTAKTPRRQDAKEKQE